MSQENAPKSAPKVVKSQLICEVCKKPLYGTPDADGRIIGSTCRHHLGKEGKFYLPAPANLNVTPAPAFIALSKLCDYAETLGYSRGFAVRLTGGDNGTVSPKYPHFQIYICSGKTKKFVSAQSRDALLALKNNKPLPEYVAPSLPEKTVRKSKK